MARGHLVVVFNNRLWMDGHMATVAICPFIYERLLNITKDAQAKLCSEVFHRFIFLVLKDAIDSCKNGTRVGGNLVALRLPMIICNQPQERMLFGLKNVGSIRDSSVCEE